MTDFSFLLKDDRVTAAARRRQQIEDIRRESLKHKLKHIANDTEQAVDYCRDLIASGADVSDELKELEQTGYGLALVALMLKRETGVK